MNIDIVFIFVLARHTIIDPLICHRDNCYSSKDTFWICFCKSQIITLWSIIWHNFYSICRAKNDRWENIYRSYLDIMISLYCRNVFFPTLHSVNNELMRSFLGIWNYKILDIELSFFVSFSIYFWPSFSKIMQQSEWRNRLMFPTLIDVIFRVVMFWYIDLLCLLNWVSNCFRQSLCISNFATCHLIKKFLM